MAIELIDSFEDPRLAPYRQMKERDLARDGRRFIAEGEQVVRRLLASTLMTESVLLSTRRQERIVSIVPEHVRIFVASDDVIEKLIGFAFHSGVMACGVRPVSPSFADLVAPSAQQQTLAVCHEIANTENMGSLIRIAAAFGCAGMLLGETCCDPFFRQSVRVSMGTVFRLPIVQSENLLGDLGELRDRWDFEIIATVLDPLAQPLATARRAPRIAVVFGNEAQGLNARVIAACSQKVTVPMALGIDSLNVGIAAGVVLYHFTMIATSNRTA